MTCSGRVGIARYAVCLRSCVLFGGCTGVDSASFSMALLHRYHFRGTIRGRLWSLSRLRCAAVQFVGSLCGDSYGCRLLVCWSVDRSSCLVSTAALLRCQLVDIIFAVVSELARCAGAGSIVSLTRWLS